MDDALVMMPAFVVNADREQPKWRYIGRQGFEVLFLTEDRLAAAFATDVAVALETLDKIVPAECLIPFRRRVGARATLPGRSRPATGFEMV